MNMKFTTKFNGPSKTIVYKIKACSKSHMTYSYTAVSEALKLKQYFLNNVFMLFVYDIFNLVDQF